MGFPMKSYPMSKSNRSATELTDRVAFGFQLVSQDLGNFQHLGPVLEP